jgi:hypothetical protein
LLTILSRSLATTTWNPNRDTAAVACWGEGPHPGPTIRIGARPAPGSPQAPATLWPPARRSETARPVNVNGLPPTPRRYRQPRSAPYRVVPTTPFRTAGAAPHQPGGGAHAGAVTPARCPPPHSAGRRAGVPRRVRGGPRGWWACG